MPIIASSEVADVRSQLELTCMKSVPILTDYRLQSIVLFTLYRDTSLLFACNSAGDVFDFDKFTHYMIFFSLFTGCGFYVSLLREFVTNRCKKTLLLTLAAPIGYKSYKSVDGI